MTTNTPEPREDGRKTCGVQQCDGVHHLDGDPTGTFSFPCPELSAPPAPTNGGGCSDWVETEAERLCEVFYDDGNPDSAAWPYREEDEREKWRNVVRRTLQPNPTQQGGEEVIERLREIQSRYPTIRLHAALAALNTKGE